MKDFANHWYIMGPKKRGMPSSLVCASVSVRCAIINLRKMRKKQGSAVAHRAAAQNGGTAIAACQP